MEYPNKSIKPIIFNKSLILQNISYKYPNSETYILKNLNIEIERGKKIGILGETGSGKSTFINIILGLIKPNSGEFLVDNRSIYSEGNITLNSWRRLIAHIPQNIFLADGSFAENIGFYEKSNSIKYNKIKSSAKNAKISELIESYEKKYDAQIGEQGILLSGGQKQRLGIARAIYKDSEVLILDEGTNALDKDTEKLVMENLININSKKDKTIISISHNLNSLSGFDVIYEMIDGKLIKK